MPFDDVADLFIIDPDGFVIRKWNSKQLNNGVLTAEFQVMLAWSAELPWLVQVPDYPKVGFWTVRVAAQGQIEDKRVRSLPNFIRPDQDVHSVLTY